jgi:hypothetical protein
MQNTSDCWRNDIIIAVGDSVCISMDSATQKAEASTTNQPYILLEPYRRRAVRLKQVRTVSSLEMP